MLFVFPHLELADFPFVKICCLFRKAEVQLSGTLPATNFSLFTQTLSKCFFLPILTPGAIPVLCKPPRFPDVF
jgi:hypothetical protein